MDTVNKSKEVATLAAGCFWCVEAVFNSIKGVETVISGYAGGNRPDPTYEEVSSGLTGHTEAVQITFDPKMISYNDLLYIFWRMHDPTTLNSQGADVGSQYRSAIFYHTSQQKKIAAFLKNKFINEKLYDKKIVTEILPFNNFYKAEDLHQKYYANNPAKAYCRIVIDPKMAKLRSEFAKFLKKS